MNVSLHDQILRASCEASLAKTCVPMQVLYGTERETGRPFAFKALKKDIKNKERRREIERELSVWEDIEHPCCARLLDYFDTDTDFYLVTDLAAGQDS